MGNGTERALSKAFIDKGKQLLEDTEKDMKETTEHCPVSASLPWIIRWLCEGKIAEYEERTNADKIPEQKATITGKPNQTVFECKLFKLTTNSIAVGNTIARWLVVAGVAAVLWFAIRTCGHIKHMRVGSVDTVHASEVVSNNP